jgi:MSHA biogenesis protein MshP
MTPRRLSPHRSTAHRSAARRVPAQPFAARGFALIPALFLIVVLGLLAVIAIRVGTGQQQAVTMSLEESRALAAAQAGIEWGAYQSLNAGSCQPSTTLNLAEASLAGFTVVVTCAATPFANGAATATSYVLQATATTGIYGQPGYVRRVVSGTYSSAT